MERDIRSFGSRKVSLAVTGKDSVKLSYFEKSAPVSSIGVSSSVPSLKMPQQKLAQLSKDLL